MFVLELAKSVLPLWLQLYDADDATNNELFVALRDLVAIMTVHDDYETRESKRGRPEISIVDESAKIPGGTGISSPRH